VRRISRRIVLIDGRGLAKRMYYYGIGMRLTGCRQSKQVGEAYCDAED